MPNEPRAPSGRGAQERNANPGRCPGLVNCGAFSAAVVYAIWLTCTDASAPEASSAGASWAEASWAEAFHSSWP